MVAATAAEEDTRLTRDQCKVLIQSGVDVSGICDHVIRPEPKRDRVKPKPKKRQTQANGNQR